MNFRSRQHEEIGIELAPLIDVILLLVIFFMVSTRFVKDSEIQLTLPQASEEAKNTPPATIEIAIDRKGQFFVKGQALVNSQLATIEQALRDAKPAAGEPVVVISADREVTHQSVIDAMDAARRVGLYHITFPTTARDTE